MNSLNRRSSLRAVAARELELNMAAAMRSRQLCMSNGLRLHIAYCGLKRCQKCDAACVKNPGSLQCGPALNFLQQ